MKTNYHIKEDQNLLVVCEVLEYDDIIMKRLSMFKQINDKNINNYIYIYENKTSALIEASMMIGAVLAVADNDQVSAMEKIGEQIGLAFQIQDDILDVTGNEEDLGKPVHSDEKNEKTTYVTWKGLEKAREDVARMTEEAVKELRRFDAPDDFLEQLLVSLVGRKK